MKHHCVLVRFVLFALVPQNDLAKAEIQVVGMASGIE